MTTRKYNPGFLSDDELVASFCVRTGEFESIVDMLRECTGSSNPHQIAIGPRGSGKTSLLLRVAVEVSRDAELRSGFFPIVFAEESYEVTSAGEFWLECLSCLATQMPHGEDAPDLHRTYEHLRTIQDDQILAELCLGALLDFSDRKGKRLVLMVENLNMMFRDMADSKAGWRLRKILQTEPRIILLASATSRFDEIDNPAHALYDLFRVMLLHPLDTNECAVLWEAVSSKCPPPETIRSLEILTGGSPRLIAIVARFGAGRSFPELMAELLDLVDDHTEYFKSHIESLPPQERRVYLALADLWKPATTKEVAARARLETSKCSAQLTRLVERGIVQVSGGTARRKQYYLTERLYNIYYLLRRARGPDSLIEALIQFMESYYSGTELRDIGAHIAYEAESFGEEMQSLARIALARLMESPALARHREELLAIIPEGFTEVAERGSVPSNVESKTRREDQRSKDTNQQAELLAAKEIFDEAVALKNQNRLEDVLAAFDEVVRRFGDSEIPTISRLVARALVIKGFTLDDLDRPEDALVSYDEVVRRFSDSNELVLLESVAKVLVIKGFTLGGLNRPEDALVACEEVVRRFGDSETPVLLESVAQALIGKGHALGDLNRPEDALVSYDEVVRRFSDSNELVLLKSVAKALVSKGFTLNDLDQSEDALVAYDEVVLRFSDSNELVLLESVAKALIGKGDILGGLNRPEDALVAYDEVVLRFSDSNELVLLESVAKALIGKGDILGGLNRPEDALVAYDEVVLRFSDSNELVLLESVATTLVYKGFILDSLNRPEDALVAYDEVVRRFGDSETLALLLSVAAAFASKGSILGGLNRPEDALVVFDEVVRRFASSETSVLLEFVAAALIGKGLALGDLDRPEDALVIFDEVVRQFGDNESSAFRVATEYALLRKAYLELECRRYMAAIETIDRALDEHRTESPENRCQAHLIRAKATLASGDLSASEQDIEVILTMLPNLDSLPKESLDLLMTFSIEIGPERMVELIQASPSANLLLPLTTALEQELGREPRVALEVAEVAEDIRKDLAKLRETQSDGVE